MAPRSRRQAFDPPRRSAAGGALLLPSTNALFASSALLVALSLGVLLGDHPASALRLTSLLPFWGGHDGDGAPDADADDPLGALAYPRRNLAAELGGDSYRAKIDEALGRKGGGANQCEGAASECPAVVGIDASFPAHHPRPSSSTISPHRTEFYDAFMEGCRERYPHASSSDGGHDHCGRHESDRLDMNRNQPRLMRNYTDVGFLKTRAPEGLYRRLKAFWDENRNKKTVEKWGRGSTFVNHWEVPTHMVDLDDPSLPGGGMDLRNAIWDGARTALSDWTGERNLGASSLYGIRVYGRGAVLAPHCDRLPLVTSAIINVDRDLDGEPWPLEVIAHDGRAYNLTLEPGDMVLYESHSVVHGRPYALEGSYYANVFVHFEPRGHTQRHGERMEAFLNDGKVTMESDEDLYERAMHRAEWERGQIEPNFLVKKDNPKTSAEGEEADDDLPDYIARGTPEEKRWKQQFVQVNPTNDNAATVPLEEALGRRGVSLTNKQRGDAAFAKWGGNSAHRAASTGDLEAIRDIAASEERRHLLFKQDKNGWEPLHEAARGGYTKIVEALLDEGAQVNSRTNQGRGGNALWWAEKTHGKNHPVVKLLRKRGGISQGPKAP